MFKSKQNTTLTANLENDFVLRVENLSKKFCRTLKRSLFYGTIDITKSMLGINYDTSTIRKAEFWALDNVSFDLKRGETLGIIGVNGSGKSTLLRLITGIFPPDNGRITYRGRIGALIAVGAGFHPHMTGKENIYLNGTILGMTKKEIDSKLGEIVEFADIGDFLEAPVSTYSSGMTVRLGFSIAVHCEPDILLVDEILAVGDIGFQLKCMNKLGKLKNKGTSIILVSHNLHAISTYCDNALVLNSGKLLFSGNIECAITAYKKMINSLHSEGEIEKVVTGTDDFEVLKVLFYPEIDKNKILMKTGGNLHCKVIYFSKNDFKNIEIDTVLRIPAATIADYFQITNKATGKRIDINKGNGQLEVVIHNINLNNYTGYLFIALWTEGRKELLLWWRNIPIQVEGNNLANSMNNFEVSYLNIPIVGLK